MEYDTEDRINHRKQNRVLVVYASDYVGISPGGIQSYIRIMDRDVPENLDIVYLGIKGEYAGFPPNQDKMIGLDVKPILGSWNLGFLFALRKFRFSDYDIVLCHRAETALFIQFFTRKPTFLVLHGGTLNAFRSRNYLFGAIYPLIELLASFFSSETACVNPEATFILTRILTTIKQAPLVVDQNIFFTDDDNKRDGIFLIGRLEKEKEFGKALDILSSTVVGANRILQIHIIGDGSQRAKLANHAARLNLDVIFHGMQSSEKVAELLKFHGKYLVITSKFEGFPIVAIEAISCGVTVLALKAPGVGKNLSTIGVKIFETPASMAKFISLNDSQKANGFLPEEKLDISFEKSAQNYWQIVTSIIDGSNKGKRGPKSNV